jgi:hypothetical protein
VLAIFVSHTARTLFGKPNVRHAFGENLEPESPEISCLPFPVRELAGEISAAFHAAVMMKGFTVLDNFVRSRVFIRPDVRV